MKYSIFIIFTLIALGTTSCGVTGVDSGSGAKISSSVIQSTVKNAERAEKEYNERAMSLPQTTVAERLTLRDAVMNMDAGKCESLKDTREYQRCQMVVFTSLASQQKDISFCKKIPMKTGAESCVESVVFQKSIDEKNTDLCDSLLKDDRKAVCKNNFYFSIAKTTKNSRECEQITDQSIKNTCIDGITLDKLSFESSDGVVCGAMKTDTGADQCSSFVSDVATAKVFITNKEVDKCNTLSNTMVRTFCQSETNLKLAQETKDKQYCTGLADGFQIADGVSKDYFTECTSFTK